MQHLTSLQPHAKVSLIAASILTFESRSISSLLGRGKGTRSLNTVWQSENLGRCSLCSTKRLVASLVCFHLHCPSLGHSSKPNCFLLPFDWTDRQQQMWWNQYRHSSCRGQLISCLFQRSSVLLTLQQFLPSLGSSKSEPPHED